MTELSTLARPYAKAVFAQALADDTLQSWSDVLTSLSQISNHPLMKKLLEDPSRNALVKAQSLIDTCQLELSPSHMNFIRLLATNKRLDLIDEIRTLFEELKIEQEKSVDVEIISTYALDDAQTQLFKKNLQDRFGKEIRLTTRVDSGLLGGAVIRAGDLVIDGSVKGKLEKLTDALSV